MATGLVGTLVNTLSGGRSFKVIDDVTGTQAISDVGVKNVRMSFRSTLMKNIGEDGLPIIDARVIYPTQVSLNIICNSADKVAEINSLLMNLTHTYSITSRGILLTGYMLDTESMAQTAAMISATPMKVTFKQIMLQGGGSPVCRNPGDSSMVMGGIKSALNVGVDAVSELTGKLSSAAAEIFG